MDERPEAEWGCSAALASTPGMAPARAMRAVAAVALLLVAAAPRPSVAGNQGQSEDRLIGSEMCGDYFFVPLVLGGDPERTLWMLLDTGASVTVVDPESVERISDADISAGQNVDLMEASIGPMSYGRLPTKARQLDHLSLTLGREIDGILGYDAFHAVLLTLDYPRREVRIREGELPEPDGRTIFKTERRTNRPFLPLRLGNRDTLVLIDSGSRGSLTLKRHSGIDWLAPPRPVGASARIDGVVMREAGRAATDALLAGVRIRTPVVVLTDGTQLVGTQILRAFEITFDQINRRMRVVRPEADAADAIVVDSLRGLGMLMQPAGDAFRVARVFPGLPAEAAGIERGDRVTHFDGRPVQGRGCETGLGAAGDPDSVTFTVERGTETLEFVVARALLLR